MQLRKMTLMIAALGLALTACNGGREDLSCESDATCLENEICHPQAKVCVQTCTSGDDCPESAGKCEAITSGSTTQICKCTTDQLCQRDTSVTDASTLSCDKTFSVCKSTGTTPTPVACTGSSQSNCAYGQFCNNGTCAAAKVADATCENFSHQNLPNWSTSSNGPVIYSVTGTGYQVGSSYCKSTAPDAFLVRVRAYRTDNWPATRAGLSGFFYVTTGADEFDVVNDGLLVPNTGYNPNGKDAEFNIYLCRPSDSKTIQVGFYFTGGNPVCENINR
ncbi:hypothetical protein [Cystobacter ferrugineus]|nr:hypothetical protein [Cystobacter ferrugineus]